MYEGKKFKNDAVNEVSLLEKNNRSRNLGIEHQNRIDDHCLHHPHLLQKRRNFDKEFLI
jgi:hypothetical protein